MFTTRRSRAARGLAVEEVRATKGPERFEESNHHPWCAGDRSFVDGWYGYLPFRSPQHRISTVGSFSLSLLLPKINVIRHGDSHHDGQHSYSRPRVRGKRRILSMWSTRDHVRRTHRVRG
ncbi:hypothetical protein GCK32_005829 [Trichostrongylus colubriformis]|uniref:Uncharacterized protein n=1 Tax=Trichostrongylus colubriformis TaxID=6319 RepID=A0AAN8EMA6_TRICO